MSPQVGEHCVKDMTEEERPTDLKESIFIPIPKKPKAIRCQEHRPISIMSQVTKLLFEIVMDRKKGKIEA